MKTSAPKYAILSVEATLVTLIIVLMPFHAFLTVWGSQLLGHYTALRLWKEALLMICVLGVLYLLITDHKIRSYTLTRRLVWLIIGYAAVQLLWGFVAYERGNVTAKALGYGLLVDLRPLAFFLITWAVTLRTNRLPRQWQKIILWPAAIVVAFGLMQKFLLAPMFLEHFGYSQYTILPSQYVNNNPEFLRLQSTLRGANPLGAYLIVPLTALAALFASGKKREWPYFVLYASGLLVLYFSFSRSAWIGYILSGLVVLGLRYKRSILKYMPWFLGCGVIALGLIIAGVHHSTSLDNVVLHTQTNSSATQLSSDEAHTNALRRGVHDVVHQPLGRGPGTAGPASVYNRPHSARLAENYFIEIGQETGWLGLALFLLINLGVGYLLWLRRADPLALALFASLIGLSFVNLLLPAWTDDTLAYVWWGLAGIAMVSPNKKPKTVEG